MLVSIKDNITIVNAVGRLIVYAATTSNPDWKNSESIAQKEEAINNIKADFDGSEYCYYSPDKDNWGWKICSKNGWPVLVPDAEEWKEKLAARCEEKEQTRKERGTEVTMTTTTCSPNCRELQKLIEDTCESSTYTNYLLNVKVYGHECEGLQGYRSRKQLVEKAISPENMLYYVGGCIAASGICNGLRLLAGDVTRIGALANTVVGCTVAPTAVMLATRTDILFEHPTAATTLSLMAGPFTPAVYHGVVKPSIVAAYERGYLSKALKFLEQTEGEKGTPAVINMLKNDDTAKKAKEQLEGIKKSLKKLKKLGLGGEQVDDAIKNIDDILKAADEGGEALDKAAEIIPTLKTNIKLINSNLKGILKGMFNKYDIACGTAGALLGTITYYAHIDWSPLESMHVDITQLGAEAIISVDKRQISIGG